MLPGMIGEEEPHAAQTGQSAGPSSGPVEARFRHSASFPEVLQRAGCSLLVSTYQAGQLIALGVAEGALSFSFHRFDQAMGVAPAAGRVSVGSKRQIWELRDHSELAGSIAPRGRFDRCFLARTSVVTGGIQAHELAWGTDQSGQPELWVVNTLFSCLAGLDPRYSWVPKWQPSFISALAGQDRCHLNGLAMRGGAPAFVSVMARTDEPAGWRNVPVDSGAVLEVTSSEVVTMGLTMPHSPRWYREDLYVLNSGLGRLELVDVETGSRAVVALLPGYARGLAFHAGLAFVGLSRIRETAVFGRVPLAGHQGELKCGLGVIDLATGTTVATLWFESGVEEIFDVQVVPGARAIAIGGASGGEEVWVVPQRPRGHQPSETSPTP